MAKNLLEYTDLLDEKELRWPAPPKVDPVRATPTIKPLKEIRAVTWNLYGTLLRISDGDLMFNHPQPIRMDVAMEKTIQEFNMWNSMVRRHGKPSEQLLPKYLNAIADAQLRSGTQKGDIPEVNSAQIWSTIVQLLEKKEYHYDHGIYGDHDQLCEKIAYFFHSALQGTEAAPNALFTLTSIAEAGLRQSLLANAQSFSLVQLTRALRTQGAIQHVSSLLTESLNVLSYEWGIRKPSVSLFAQSILRHKAMGIEPGQILHVGTRMKEDLAVAKSCGFRTVLYAADRTSLQAAPEDLKDTETRPDLLITDLSQLRDILQI